VSSVSRRTTKEPAYYQLDRAELYAFARRAGLRVRGRVLNVGCGAGNDSRLLRELGGREIHGVEPFEEAAALARGNYDQVSVGPVEAWTWDRRPYSMIVLADVLEHLVDPYALLAEARSWLSEDGHVLISIPNVRHLSVLWQLVVRGEWRYREHGIMDSTHLRFFTSASFRRALDDSGYELVALHRWGSNRLARTIGGILPWSGEFLLSLIFLLARPARP
jgi:2-polyprenyl-3-methyl-5-hydroxy-6-metoxy-1,4-benzoquinol methylase